MSRQLCDEPNYYKIRQWEIESKDLVKPFRVLIPQFIIIEMTLTLWIPLTDAELTLILHGNIRIAMNHLFNECIHIEKTWCQIGYISNRQISYNLTRPALKYNSETSTYVTLSARVGTS